MAENFQKAHRGRGGKQFHPGSKKKEPQPGSQASFSRHDASMAENSQKPHWGRGGKQFHPGSKKKEPQPGSQTSSLSHDVTSSLSFRAGHPVNSLQSHAKHISSQPGWNEGKRQPAPAVNKTFPSDSGQSSNYAPLSPLFNIPLKNSTAASMSLQHRVTNLQPQLKKGIPGQASPLSSFPKNDQFHSQSASVPASEKDAYKSKNDCEGKQKHRSRTRHKKANQNFGNSWWSKKKQQMSKSNVSSPQDLLGFSRTATPLSVPLYEDDTEEISESSPNTFTEVERLCENSSSDDSSSEESELSQLSSALSQTENSAPSNIAVYDDEPWCSSGGEERFISVFWDIENCPVPSKKSAVDIVGKIRNMYYEGRTEIAFTVVCDTRNLNTQVERELQESQVTLMHVSSLSKNSADVKLQRTLLEFQYQYRLKDVAVLLVSGDSDFSTYLSDLRYKHHFYVYLICNKTARRALKIAAHNCVQYDDFLNDLPDRPEEDTRLHYLLVNNLPSNVEKKTIKTFFTGNLIGVNARVANVLPNQVEIFCSNESSCEKAFATLNAVNFNGSLLSVKKVVRNSVQKILKEKQCADKHNDVTNTLFDSSINVTSVTAANMKSHKDGVKENVPKVKPSSSLKESLASNDSGKMVTLYVFVNTKEGDVSYWHAKFTDLFGHSEFHIQWYEADLIGYFLLRFMSRSKAKKARKILETNQKTDNQAPRFLKLVKNDVSGQAEATRSPEQDLRCIAMKRIEEKVQCIQTMKEKCLEKFQSLWESHKPSHFGNKISILPTEMKEKYVAVAGSRRSELNEQKVAFLNFTDTVCNAVKGLDIGAESIDSKIEDIMRDYHLECRSFENGLPIYSKKNSVVKHIKNNQVVVIQAHPEFGKSTQICQYLWREGFGNKGIIVCVQLQKNTAVSLAKHLSYQVGCSIGTTVGYKVNSFKKVSNQTKILYVTDLVLLDMYSEDPLFSNISCIIVDEAHKRAVYSELLLAMIKRSLSQRPEIRVVILTAGSNVRYVFQNYFGLPDSSIMVFPYLAFPVEAVWMESNACLDSFQLEKALLRVLSVIIQEPGNVLVFLPTPTETEKAVETFRVFIQQRSGMFYIYSFHEEQEFQEQQKIFEKLPDGVYKIIFTTDYAENIVTVPDIQYVVDSGMVKKSSYDDVNKLNVVAVGSISKYSAELRRSLAGSTGHGKCYRLYTENFFQDMPNDVVPEIMRSDLSYPLLKLMSLGVRNCYEFSYITVPPRNLMANAVKHLQHLEAVTTVDNSLTQFGSKIASLPIEPHLSHLVLKGIENGIGYEAIVIAALATVSQNVPLYDSHNKRNRFCQFESDYLTYLRVYKEWIDVPKESKSRWCALNCINEMFIKSSHGLINELVTVIKNCLGITVTTKFADESALLPVIKNIIYLSFSHHICVFSGQSETGYLSPDNAESFYIHPSSSLYGLGERSPQYVVYEIVFKTSHLFLMNVTAVDETLLRKADKEKFSSVKCLNPLSALKPYSIPRLGHTMLKSLIGPKGSKKKIIEGALIDICGGKRCAISADFVNGQLNVFASCGQKQAESIIMPFVKELHDQILKEENIIANFLDIPSLTAVMGAGGSIVDVILPGEYRDVKVKPPCKTSQILQKLEKFGNVISVCETKKHKRVTYGTVASAEAAVRSLSNMKSPFIVEPCGKSDAPEPSSSFVILVSFVRRPCVGRAFFSVMPTTSISNVLNILSHRDIKVGSNNLKIYTSKTNPNDLCINNVPTVVNDTELKATISKHLPPNVKLSKFIVEYKKEFASCISDIEAFKNKVRNLFSNFAQPHTLNVELKTPDPKDKQWKTLVYFDNPHDGQNAVNILSGAHLFKHDDLIQSIITVKPVLETTLYCSNEIFDAVKLEMGNTLRCFSESSHKDNQLDIHAKASKDKKQVIIHIHSNNVTDIIDAKMAIQSLIQGRDFYFGDVGPLNNLFTNKSGDTVNKIKSKVPDSYIHLNHHKSTVSYYGSERACNAVKSSVDEYVSSVASQGIIMIDMPVNVTDGKKSLLKEIIKLYSLSLEKLCSSSSILSAKLNIQKRVLTISGDQNSLFQCQTMISSILDGDIHRSCEPASNTELCPVCCCDVTSPFYRFEYCGHVYCDVCLLAYLLYAEEMPVVCCVKDCQKPIVLRDLIWATKKDKPLTKKIQTTALKSFLSQRQDVKFCPMPDCPMLYRVSSVDCKNGKPCPLCKNDVCTKCNVLYHTGMSCNFYKNCVENGDRGIKAWLKVNPKMRKLCPFCRCPVEKNCVGQHMTCWKCKIHMCWGCLMTSKFSDHILMHLPVCSGI